MKAVAVGFRRPLSLCEPLLLLLMLMNVLPLASTQDVRMPPSITSGPVMHKHYKDKSNVTLDCVGVGQPSPTYEWLKNGIPLNVNTGNIQIRPGVGTIDIKSCTAADEGYYQCILTNSYGKTMSNTTFLQMASLASFPPNAGGLYPYSADVNGHTCMLCKDKPPSIPAADIYWTYNFSANPGKPITVVQDSRIQTDPFTGSLCLTHIQSDDGTSNIGKFYICNVENTVVQTIHQGSQSQLTITSTVMGAYAPLLTFSTTSTVIGIEGEGMTLRCFFSGNPVPTIAWKKDGLLAPQDRWDNTAHSGTGLALKSGKLTQEDAGLYACEASNGVGGSAVVHTMQLSVHVRPVFQGSDSQPHNMNVTEGETANISCNPRAIPEVTIRWYKNQVEFTAANLPPKMNLSADLKTLTIVDVCKKCYDGNSGDLMVIQCNASNQHGYSFAQGYMNVLIATTMTSVGGNRPWIAYQNEVFDAVATTDDSTPLTHTWTHNGYTIQVTETIYVAANGSLVVLTQNDTDGGQGRMGEYKCVVSNGFSQAEIIYIYGETIVVESSEPWWIIGLVLGLLLLLLLLLLLIFCFCCNNEGDSYPVDKNERKNGNIPEKELKDTGFQSYLTQSEDYAAAGSVVVAVAPPVFGANDSYSSKGAMYMGGAVGGVEASMTAVKYDNNNYAMKTMTTTTNVEGGVAVVGSTAAVAYRGGGKLEGDSDEDEAFHEGDDRSSISTVAAIEASGHYNASSAAVVRTRTVELSPASLLTQQQHYQQHQGNYQYDINDGSYNHGAVYLGAGHQASAAAVVQSRYSVRYMGGGSDEQYARNEHHLYAPVPPPRSRRSSSASSKQVQDYNAFKTSEV